MRAAMMKIADIKVGDRFRKEMGDIAALAKNIDEVALVHPIVVTSDGRLIAGERRIKAFKLLGRDEIPATVIDLDQVMAGEYAENVFRKDFTPSETVGILRALEPIERERAKERQRLSNGRGKKGRGNSLTTPGQGDRKTITKAANVVDAAEAEPEKYAHLVEQMDRTGNVSKAFRALSVARDQQRILLLAPVVGKFKTLVLDPPWQYDADLAGRGAPSYQTMTHAELLALDVVKWAEDDAHMYLWATNAMLPKAFELMSACGFSYNTLITWAVGHGRAFSWADRARVVRHPRQALDPAQ
jgi:ParB-like chromosome segregation protein Spo0J